MVCNPHKSICRSSFVPAFHIKVIRSETGPSWWAVQTRTQTHTFTHSKHGLCKQCCNSRLLLRFAFHLLMYSWKHCWRGVCKWFFLLRRAANLRCFVLRLMLWEVVHIQILQQITVHSVSVRQRERESHLSIWTDTIYNPIYSIGKWGQCYCITIIK